MQVTTVYSFTASPKHSAYSTQPPTIPNFITAPLNQPDGSIQRSLATSYNSPSGLLATSMLPTSVPNFMAPLRQQANPMQPPFATSYIVPLRQLATSMQPPPGPSFTAPLGHTASSIQVCTAADLHSQKNLG